MTDRSSGPGISHEEFFMLVLGTNMDDIPPCPDVWVNVPPHDAAPAGLEDDLILRHCTKALEPFPSALDIEP